MFLNVRPAVCQRLRAKGDVELWAVLWWSLKPQSRPCHAGRRPTVRHVRRPSSPTDGVQTPAKARQQRARLAAMSEEEVAKEVEESEKHAGLRTLTTIVCTSVWFGWLA